MCRSFHIDLTVVCQSEVHQFGTPLMFVMYRVLKPNETTNSTITFHSFHQNFTNEKGEKN